ncbi:MAG TPA: hypothetical protein DER23_01635, partial [Clostridiales bacterium]|nr:hypothetical protein [Clostridiales bacterium]
MSKHIRRMVSFFLILIVSFSLAAPVFATGDNAATIQIGSLTSDVTRTAYSYKAAQKSLYLSGGKYILVGDINTEYTLKIYVYGNAQIEIRNLMAVQDNAGEFNAGTPVMEISGGRTVDLKFTGNCVFRGGALSAGILVMDKVTLHILPTTDTSTFSCGVYRYGGAGIGVADSSCNATISLDASKLTSGYIALGGGVKGVDNQDGVAVDPGKSGKLMVNNTKVNNIRRAMRWSGNTSKEVYALYVNGGTGSTWFAACGDRITVKAVLETGQIFEKWYDEPDSPIAFSTPKSTTATFGMPSYDVYIYAVSYRTDGTKLDIYNISIQGGESDALACNAGEIIAIIASTFVGKKFITWKYEGPTKVEFADPKSMSTTFVMPKGHVIIVAEFQDEGLPITVVGGDASRESAIPGTVITITAKPPENMVFFQWKITEGKGSDGKNLNLANKSNAVTTFVMIDKAVSIKAIFVESPRTVSIAGGIADKKMADKGEKITVLATLKEGEVFKEWEVVYVSAAGKNTKSQKVYKDTFTNIEKEYQSITRIRAIVEKKATYPITVENGTADHTEATAGTVVTVTAVVPENQKLVSWYIDAEGVELESPLSLNTTFVMPSSPVKVTAAFEEEKVPS